MVATLDSTFKWCFAVHFRRWFIRRLVSINMMFSRDGMEASVVLAGVGMTLYPYYLSPAKDMVLLVIDMVIDISAVLVLALILGV